MAQTLSGGEAVGTTSVDEVDAEGLARLYFGLTGVRIDAGGGLAP